MTQEEIMSRKAEIKAMLESNEDVDLDEIKRELDELDEQLRNLEQPEEKVEEEPVEEVAEEISEEVPAEQVVEEHEEDASAERRRIAEAINNRSIENAKEIKKEEKKMEQKRFTLASPEYRSAWAKTLMGVKLTEDETRALGDAITTTATTFVEADADTNGINNAGLLIPTTVREELMENIYQVSPFLRDVRKLQVRGIVDLPFLYESDDADWYAEANCTANEGIEFKSIQLTGWDLAKDVVITWKAEEMAVESFIAFIIDELTMKMGRALATAVLYGTGSSEPTGALNGLVAQTDADPIQVIKKAKAQLSSVAKIGAKAYISENVADEIVFKKDGNNNYPFINGLPRIAELPVEVDPFLQNSDVLVGNPKYYVLNESRAITIDKEKSVKCRKTTFGAYGVYDGKAKTGSFAKGQVTSASI